MPSREPAMTTACWTLAVMVAVAAEPRPYHFDPDSPAWNRVHLQGPLSAAETRVFMRSLAEYVFAHHLKKNAQSPQRGMIYEYDNVPRQAQVDEHIQGEGLDTMHDGAWFCAALVHAARVTGDPWYKQFLVDWPLPFYLRMLNHSDTLLDANRDDSRPGTKPWGKEWRQQPGETGFVPYYWDDGGSVSLDRRMARSPVATLPSVDFLAGKPNPDFLLNGYSHGSSNHLAQDLGVMLQQAWLLLKDDADPAAQKLVPELVAAIGNLHACRMRHHGPIPMCVAPAALVTGNPQLMRQVPDPAQRYATLSNHYTLALIDIPPGVPRPTPGFADDQEYNYYSGIARTAGQVPRELAFRTLYDAYTHPMLYRYYSDDAPVPAGVNRMDLYASYFVDGKPQYYRSDRRGPNHGPQPIGSRMGPQNTVVCGWALQLLRAQPGLWEERYRQKFSADLRVPIEERLPGAEPVAPAECELGGQRLKVSSTLHALQLELAVPAKAIELKLFAEPDGGGSFAAIALAPDGRATAVNDRAETLLLETTPGPSAQGRRVCLRLPYTVAKGQHAWANAIEHGRLSIAVQGQRRNLYLLSPEPQVAAWLEHELGSGLRTWRAIFDTCGYIPTGLGNGTLPIAPGATWDQMSDTGGYAHLISAATQWLLCLEGRRDWELWKIPRVLP